MIDTLADTPRWWPIDGDNLLSVWFQRLVSWDTIGFHVCRSLDSTTRFQIPPCPFLKDFADNDLVLMDYWVWTSHSCSAQRNSMTTDRFTKCCRFQFDHKPLP